MEIWVSQGTETAKSLLPQRAKWRVQRVPLFTPELPTGHFPRHINCEMHPALDAR